MKHFFTTLFLIAALMQAVGQRQYLPTPEDLDRLRSTTTYVVLSNNPLSDYNFQIRDAVEKYWTLTGYEFLPFEEFEEKSLDPGASFLYTAAVNFEKDKSHTRYLFLCLSLGGERETLDDLKDITNLPLSYYGVDEDHYSYKLGTFIRFMQGHVELITAQPDLVSQNVFEYYNDNMGDLQGKTLYLVEEELQYSVSTESQIRALYPHDFRIVEREEIEELILDGDENAVFLHKVGPEDRNQEARVYKILIGAADARFYYFDYHKSGGKHPDAFLEQDFKRLARGR